MKYIFAPKMDLLNHEKLKIVVNIENKKKYYSLKNLFCVAMFCFSVLSFQKKVELRLRSESDQSQYSAVSQSSILFLYFFFKVFFPKKN